MDLAGGASPDAGGRPLDQPGHGRVPPGEALAEAPDTAQLGLGDQLRALALIGLGAAQLWTARLDEAERHLEQGLARELVGLSPTAAMTDIT